MPNYRKGRSFLLSHSMNFMQTDMMLDTIVLITVLCDVNNLQECGTIS